MNIVATRQRDMVSGLLAEYAVGGLSRPTRVLVESHLEMAPSGRSWVKDVDAVGDVFEQDAPQREEASGDHESVDALERMEPSAFADPHSALDKVLTMIDADDDQTSSPKALERFLGMPVADVPWKKVMPGLAEYRLPDADGAEVSLLRIDGGKAMPVHTHHGSEITLVLQGGFSDGNGHYAVGDIAYADDDINHRPVADEGETCICFAVVDAPVQLTGPIGRLVNSFIR
ncbi:MAG: ChrR family anti-sigma-E factor [Pseudomonadota bacterium]